MIFTHLRTTADIPEIAKDVSCLAEWDIDVLGVGEAIKEHS